MKRLAVLGASGHGKVIAEIAELNGWKVFFFDDAYPGVSDLEHWPVVGGTEQLINTLSSFQGCFIAIGNNRIRLQKQLQLFSFGAHFPVLIHPNSVVSRMATLQDGTVVMANAVVNPFTRVGRANILNTSSTVDHDCVLADGVHISPGANLAGSVHVGTCSWVGIGASVKQCVTIGENVTVGANAAVVSNVSDDKTIVGIPAKPLGS
ncbi:acetyltransferase [Thiomicrorhabdus sp. 6S3-12]|uniref:acetyltransferase n=1 Tax=Thiomicrorhabdus sp. 6S3-12 TaxID=2819681 RepID=UPI001AACB45D|nr:acetyltransferase [Thiomicrorhabdus sp. 6S3-12]MBO1922983.1 acetyltransferase [Thiomicrorhabdus sp. 6S3-12]